MAEQIAVTHFGPRLDEPGGMQSVLRTYLGFSDPRFRIEFFETYSQSSALKGGRQLVGALAKLAVLGATRRDRIAHFHVSQRGSFLREGVLVRAARSVGVPVCISIHGSRFVPFLEAHPRIVMSVLSRADAVLVLSEQIATVLRARGLRRVELFPNPVAVPADVGAPSASPPVALFGGEAGRRKGVDVLMEAWPGVRERVPEAELQIAGPRSDVPQVDVPGVSWLGSVEHDRLLELMRDSRVAVLPSRAEGMPIFILEAMAAARPVVATPVGGVEWLVGDAGVIVPVGDQERLAEALVDLLADPTRADALGRRGRERVGSTFGADVIAARLGDLYAELVRR